MKKSGFPSTGMNNRRTLKERKLKRKKSEKKNSKKG
jgi:hypothetical protein